MNVFENNIITSVGMNKLILTKLDFCSIIFMFVIINAQYH